MLDFFSTFLRSRIDWRLSASSLSFFANTLISEAKASFWTVRIISAVAWLVSSRGGRSGFLFSSFSWLSYVARESNSVLRYRALRIRCAMARRKLDHSDKRSNRLEPSPWAGTASVAHTFTVECTSGSFSSISMLCSTSGIIGDEFCLRKEGPLSQSESTSAFTVTPRVAKSAGFKDVSIYRHCLGSETSRIIWTRFAT